MFLIAYMGLVCLITYLFTCLLVDLGVCVCWLTCTCDFNVGGCLGWVTDKFVVSYIVDYLGCFGRL